jgi:hypothetical protein
MSHEKPTNTAQGSSATSEERCIQVSTAPATTENVLNVLNGCLLCNQKAPPVAYTNIHALRAVPARVDSTNPVPDGCGQLRNNLEVLTTFLVQECSCIRSPTNLELVQQLPKSEYLDITAYMAGAEGGLRDTLRSFGNPPIFELSLDSEVPLSPHILAVVFTEIERAGLQVEGLFTSASDYVKSIRKFGRTFWTSIIMAFSSPVVS